MPDHPLKGRPKSPEHAAKIRAATRDPVIKAKREATRVANLAVTPRVDAICGKCSQTFSPAGYTYHAKYCSMPCQQPGCNEVQIMTHRCDAHYISYRLAKSWNYQRDEAWFYQKLIAAPECEICHIAGKLAKYLNRDPWSTNLTMCVDHCHDTGLIRGTVCQSCNKLLGALQDRPMNALSLVAYLNKIPLGSYIGSASDTILYAQCRFCDKQFVTEYGGPAHLQHCLAYRQLDPKPCCYIDCNNFRTPHSRSAKCKECEVASNVARKYHTSIPETRVLLQVPRCQSCDELFPASGSRIEKYAAEIDHCHATGHLRGKLCRPCNSALGYANDDVKLLQAAASYLDYYARAVS
jgi:hypothetical protein